MTENPLGYEKIPKLLKGFAIPSIMAALVGSLYNIVDQIFIGQGVGYLGNAATNVSYPFSTICLAISLLLGIGSASRVSLYLGKQRPKAAARAAGNGIVLMVILGLIYLVIGEIFLNQLLKLFGATAEVFPYARQYAGITLAGMPCLIVTNGMSNLIRADGSPRYSMICMIAGAIVNTILDPIFIFIFHWGIFGAALATVLGQIFSFVLAVYYLWHFKTLRFEKSSFHLSIKESLKTCSMGISSSSNQIAITFVQIVLYNSLTYYGAQTVYGTDIPLAACGIVMKTNAIVLAVIVGISQGVQPIIGFNYGAKQYTRVREAYLLAVKWNLVVSAIGFFLFQRYPQFIISLFGNGDQLYFEFAVLFMRTYLFMVLVNGVQLLSSSFFTAIGKAMKGALLALTRQVFFLIPLILVLPLRFGIMGVLLAGPIADFAAFLLSVVLVSIELRKQKTIQQINSM
ncbi:MAG: MATE family efflux transporter [Lachnospiraceae bacterium]|nr:MATE family efflux transporter [Lachnospiraceae bacterium]